eukprot:447655-Prorocentrum_minimum.AAC.1
MFSPNGVGGSEGSNTPMSTMSEDIQSSAEMFGMLRARGVGAIAILDTNGGGSPGSPGSNGSPGS